MTPQERYDANLERLRERNATLAAQVDALPLHNMVLQPSAKDPNVLVGLTWDVHHQAWIPLSSDDPVAEAEKDADHWYTKDKMVFCLIGMGLGYFAAALARRMKPYQRLGIFEFSPIHYKASMHCIDLGELLSRDGLAVETFLGNNLHDNLRHWFQTFEINQKFHIQEPMRSGYTNHYEKAMHDNLGVVLSDMIRYHAVGLATWAQYGRHICENDFDNIPEYMMTPGFDKLAGAWQGRPAVCVAAGPSLRKNLGQLLDPDVRDKIGVISVGTVYALLNGIGLKPDLVTTIDFQPLNWTDQFRHVPLDDPPALCYLHSTYPATVRRWPGPRFVALNSSDASGWMSKFAEPKKPAGHVQTVAHLSLIAALEMGADPVILIGQDLSMPYGEHHAPGARVQDLSPEEHPGSHIQATDYAGGKCWTRHSFLSMKTVFEQIIAQYPGCRIINCTEGGLPLAGAENRPLHDVLAEFATDVPPRPLSQEITNRFKAYEPQVDWDGLENALHDLTMQVSVVRAEAGPWLQDYEKWVTEGGTAADGDDLVKRGDVVTANTHALNLFMIRRFDMLERLSAIPLGPEIPEEQHRTEKLARIAAIFTAIASEGDDVATLLGMTQKRIQDMTDALEPEAVYDISRLLARESILAASAILDSGSLAIGGATQYRRLLAQVAYHRQQYASAMAIAPFSDGLVRRSMARLDEHRRQVSGAARAYYRQGEEAAITGPQDAEMAAITD